MPDVSVIIPVYNRAAMVKDALKSVLSQTLTDIELIVVDDGSTDDTLEVLGSFSDPRLKVLSGKRKGVAAARNRAAMVSEGRYLAFLDSDDLWLPEKLEMQLPFHQKNKNMPLSHTDEIWIRNGKRVNQMKKHEKKGGRIFEHCLPMCRISPSAAIIEREYFLSIGGFDAKFCVCEDYELWLRVSAEHEVAYLDRKLTVKRGGHEDQLSRGTWGFDRFRVMALVKIIESGSLDDEQKKAACGVLAGKADILARGYRKRKRFRQAEKYLSIAAQANALVKNSGLIKGNE